MIEQPHSGQLATLAQLAEQNLMEITSMVSTAYHQREKHTLFLAFKRKTYVLTRDHFSFINNDNSDSISFCKMTECFFEEPLILKNTGSLHIVESREWATQIGRVPRFKELVDFVCTWPKSFPPQWHFRCDQLDSNPYLPNNLVS